VYAVWEPNNRENVVWTKGQSGCWLDQTTNTLLFDSLPPSPHWNLSVIVAANSIVFGVWSGKANAVLHVTPLEDIHFW